MKRKILLFMFCSSIILVLSGCPGKEQETNPNVTEQSIPPASLSPTLTAAPSPTTEPRDPNEISSFSTILYDKNEHRINNIKTAAEDLNHTILRPGEVFSFNDTVGRRTEGKGYEEAPILVDGEKSKGVGGGVCQISSTLYNAALEADMKILERHRHSKPVPYVEEGKDATVVYNSKDLRFRNTKDYPVEILISVSEDEIEIAFHKKTEEKEEDKDQ